MGLGLSWWQAAPGLTAPCGRSCLDYPTSVLRGDTGPSLALLPEWIKAKSFYIPLFCCVEVAARCVKHLTSICHLSIQSSPANSKDFMPQRLLLPLAGADRLSNKCHLTEMWQRWDQVFISGISVLVSHTLEVAPVPHIYSPVVPGITVAPDGEPRTRAPLPAHLLLSSHPSWLLALKWNGAFSWAGWKCLGLKHSTAWNLGSSPGLIRICSFPLCHPLLSTGSWRIKVAWTVTCPAVCHGKHVLAMDTNNWIL